MQCRLAAVAITILLMPFVSLCQEAAATADKHDWIQLFNGRNLDGWTVKIAKHKVGENFGNTFRVENGLLRIAYDHYDTLSGQFGHLFYTYTKPQLGGDVKSPEFATRAGELLSEGYIAIQAESAPTEFRKIEVLNLIGCMDKKAKNFKRYYVKADNTKCLY